MAPNRRRANAKDPLATTSAQMTRVMQAQTEAICQMNGNARGVVTNLIMPMNPQYVRLSKFCRNYPPFLCGSVDPLEAEEWLQKLERIFSVMRCDDVLKVDFATYMLEYDVKHWRNNAKGSLETQGAPITWEEFKEVFLEKYFPHNVHIQKETKFLQLRQEEMTVVEFVAKFENLARFSHYLKDNPQDDWKAIKFEEGLKPELKSSISILELRDYPTLLNKCCIAEKKCKQ